MLYGFLEPGFFSHNLFQLQYLIHFRKFHFHLIHVLLIHYSSILASSSVSFCAYTAVAPVFSDAAFGLLPTAQIWYVK